MKYIHSLVISLCMATLSQADTSAPLFAGSTLSIQGDTYTWTSATEDSTWHYDTYTDASSQTVTVKGLLGGSWWAMVSGPGTATTISGHIENGVYGENHQTFSGDGSWVVNGVTYTHRERQADYSMQGDGFYGYYLGSAGYDNYTNANGTTYNTSWYANGDSHSSFSGGTTSFFGAPSDLTVFGMTYQFQNSSSFSDAASDANLNGWTDNFLAPNGSTLQVNYKYNAGFVGYSLQVWDPHLGTLTSNAVAVKPDSAFTGMTWRARTAPTFAKPQLWVDGKLLNWQSGSITTTGSLTDTYSGAGLTLTIQAQVSDYFAAGSTTAATVAITSGDTGSGTQAQDKTFSVSGHTVMNAEPNHSAPLFTGANTIYRIINVNYAFMGGFQDSLGNRTDVYVSPQMGTISISGTTANAYVGTVKVIRNATIYSGTYNNGVFNVTGNIISWLSSQPSIYGPPAFWVRGELYKQNTSTRTNYATATTGHSLTLSGTTTWTLAGADATGAFSGPCSTDPVGVFTVQALDESSQPIAGVAVPVVPANADGTVYLDWSAPPSGMPPAVIENNHVLVYLGTATEDTSTSTTAAYYGSAALTDQTPWLLKLRTDGSGVATFTDYSTGTSSPGSYSTETHLFQTATAASGFPMPVYGVDPNANDAQWGQAQPPAGLPATFMVRGQPWWLAGYDAASDTATYQGYYTGQLMTLGAADTTGERLVTLTDPIYNQGSTATTQGSLNPQRHSAQLRDGTLVLSGTDQGQQSEVPHTDDYKLQTIASDLDILGNNLSFGILSGDASRVGALFQFADDASTASLYSILSRQQSRWSWWKAPGVDSATMRRVMELDADHRLQIFKSGDDANPAIVLDPAGTTSFKGPVRVPQSGDIPMGSYQAGDPP